MTQHPSSASAQIRMFTLDDLDLPSLRGQRVFVRVDFNAPLGETPGAADGEVEVTDDTRLREALPTLQELRAAGARLVLASHCGRPKGEPNPRYSLRPMVKVLASLLDAPVAFAEDCLGEVARAAVDQLQDGGVVLLENLRFHAGEKADDDAFSAELASLADAYVCDAFGTAHRAHASVVGVPARLSRKAAGRLLVREIEALGRLLHEPARPFAGILGGAKIEGKIDTLDNLLPRLDQLLIGGGMANTFLAAQGLDLASSLVERDRLDLAKSILERAAAADTEVLLPSDLVIADDFAQPQRIETVAANAVPAGTMALDIGPEACKAFAEALGRAGTIFWNGPMGVFEKPPFDAGTVAVAHGVADSPAFKVVGGGDTVGAAAHAGVLDRMDHVSTGGGASLEFLAGKELPGVTALAK